MLHVTGKDGHFCSRRHEDSAEVHFKTRPHGKHCPHTVYRLQNQDEEKKKMTWPPGRSVKKGGEEQNANPPQDNLVNEM